jgi:hypothetical protein
LTIFSRQKQALFAIQSFIWVLSYTRITFSPAKLTLPSQKHLGRRQSLRSTVKEVLPPYRFLLANKFSISSALYFTVIAVKIDALSNVSPMNKPIVVHTEKRENDSQTKNYIREFLDQPSTTLHKSAFIVIHYQIEQPC